MPNYCWNVLRVSGGESEVEEFEKAARLGEGEIPSVDARDICLSKIVPVPDELENPSKGEKDDKERIKKYGTSNACDWRRENWGTVKDTIWTCEAGMVRNAEMVTYYFDTAWSPPIAWLKLASKKFPYLVFLMKFVEQDYYFRGIALAIDGEVMYRSQKMEGIDFSQPWKPMPKGWKPKQPNTDRLSDFGF